jgi:hypothetical protein
MRTQFTEDNLCENGIFYNRHEKIEPGYTRYEYGCCYNGLHIRNGFVNILGGKANFIKLLENWNRTKNWYYYETQR